MIRLQVAGGDLHAFEGEQVRLGRGEGVNLRLTPVHVSSEHALIMPHGEGYLLRDLHSTNGTRVLRDGEELDLGELVGREVILEDGDVLSLGDREAPVQVVVAIDGEIDTAKVVALRKVDDLGAVEGAVDRELLQGLYQAQREISSCLEIEPLLDTVAECVFGFLSRATHITVALIEEEGASSASSAFVPIGTRVRGAQGGAETVPITRSVFKKVIAERAAVLAADAKRDVGETESLMAAQILSTIGVPLWIGERILGVIQVDNRASSGIFRETDLDVLAVLAQTTSQAFHHARLYRRLQLAEERARTENTYLKDRDRGQRVENIIAESAAMNRVFEQLRRVVDTRVSVLVEGETGTGKELVASAVHYWSSRAEKLFVAQNCAAMPENLLESELFGHRKGAFTGATDDKKGLFELAHKGTLFLDEVGEMPVSLQAKLLRVLQEGEIRPVGDGTTKKVDVRVVAATNRDLEKEVAEGRFREDLYYRLRVFPVRIPPLRERRDDVPPLVHHFLGRYAKEFGRPVEGISQAAMELLVAYDWPGNVRELENEVQRIVIQSDGAALVDVEHLSPKARGAIGPAGRVKPAKGPLKQMMEEVEKGFLIEALREHQNNKSATAKTLGMTREGLHKKLRGYGLT
ncbi:MAG: sigma 54-interacting transcriptional regulator [Myxococcales bacterium]|nr:sigma 54-interacting transcriptional regulator [Myxococcales bacterium]